MKKQLIIIGIFFILFFIIYFLSNNSVIFVPNGYQVIVKQNKNKKLLSEGIQWKSDLIDIQYDLNENVHSMVIKKSNMKIILNMNKNKISSYEIKNGDYTIITNLNEAQNLVNRKEIMQAGSFIYNFKKGNFIQVIKLEK